MGGKVLKKKRLAAFALATMLLSSTTIGAEAAGTYSWKYQGKKWYYLNSSGEPVTGWVFYNNKWYYLGKNGVMQTGWLKDRSIWYYLDSSGAMITGWRYIGKKWYYFNGSGAMKTGWVYDKGKWYYLDSSGAMKTGWVYDKSHWYYMEKSGAMKTGWLEEKKVKYYLLPSGEMVTGQKMIDGKPYTFSASGAMTTTPKGWFQDGAKIAYINADGSMHKGWLIKDNKKYYFGSDGLMRKGWLTIGENKYYLGEDGAAFTGWKLIQNKWYYFYDDGLMATGWLYYNKKWYFLNSNGVKQTGWLKDKNDWYYLNSNGEMVTGWLKLGEDWYYLTSSGKRVTGEQVIDGKKYYFFPNGVLNTGPIVKTTNYSISLKQMVDIQMKYSPQTDKYRNQNGFVKKKEIQLDPNHPGIGKMTTQNGVNILESPNLSAHVYGFMNKYYKDSNGELKEQLVQIVSESGDFYEIKYPVTWRNAKAGDVQYYANPNNFKSSSTEYYQYLVLSGSAGTDAKELNAKVLKGKGTLEDQAEAFIQASKDFNINEIYLINHAFLETGKGTSKLAQGIVVNGKKVYNMYGIGAKDSCPNECGAQYAYEQGWDTPAKAIYGGAKYIAKQYINNPNRKQDTLYKMRWDPEAGLNSHHQYATDIQWAVKQAKNIKQIYDTIESRSNLHFDVPILKQ